MEAGQRQPPQNFYTSHEPLSQTLQRVPQAWQRPRTCLCLVAAVGSGATFLPAGKAPCQPSKSEFQTSPQQRAVNIFWPKTSFGMGPAPQNAPNQGTSFPQRQLDGPISLLSRCKVSRRCPHPKGPSLHSQGTQTRRRGAAQPGSREPGTHTSHRSEEFCSRLLPWSKCPLVAAGTCLRNISHFTWF